MGALLETPIAFLAFAPIALLYVVTEELLLEEAIG